MSKEQMFIKIDFSLIVKLGVMSLFVVLGGCVLRYNSYADFNDSLERKYYEQASVRLERCAGYSRKDKNRCSALMESLQKYNLPIDEAVRKFHEEQLADVAKKKENERVAVLRNSKNPWDKLSLSLDIQAGIVNEEYPNESISLIEQAFYGFGECAKQAVPSCMTQYAQMIIYGMNILSPKERKIAKDKALYWLNLSARYGNEEARRLLISLEESIPTPDLSMESLQKTANSIARDEIEAKKEAERRKSYYESQMLQAQNQANFISSMNYFLPKTVTCTSNSIGSNTFTSCH